jgi:hypothetical protein
MSVESRQNTESRPTAPTLSLSLQTYWVLRQSLEETLTRRRPPKYNNVIKLINQTHPEVITKITSNIVP